MLNGYTTSSEYEPLSGSSASPNQKRAYMTAGGTFILLACIFAFTGSTNTAIPVQQAVVTTVPAVQEAVAPVVEATETVAVAPAVDAAADVAADVPTQIADTVVDETFTETQYNLVYNFLSFAIAAMGASTVFFFFQFSLVDKEFRTALTITGLVTLIAFYHYIRIFNSFTDAYVNTNGIIATSGVPFNDAYRYVDWLLTVPLLLMEIVLVMRLPADETSSLCVRLGSAAAIMVILGYPGEISDDDSTRWTYWVLAMIPFVYIVYTLFVGLSDAVANQPERARGLVNAARWITVISWCTYPIVFIFPMLGLTGASAKTAIQLGYSIADVIAKPGMGLVAWQVAVKKSKGGDL